jgi:hypothetical protein
VQTEDPFADLFDEDGNAEKDSTAATPTPAAPVQTDTNTPESRAQIVIRHLQSATIESYDQTSTNTYINAINTILQNRSQLQSTTVQSLEQLKTRLQGHLEQIQSDASPAPTSAALPAAPTSAVLPATPATRGSSTPRNTELQMITRKDDLPFHLATATEDQLRSMLRQTNINQNLKLTISSRLRTLRITNINHEMADGPGTGQYQAPTLPASTPAALPAGQSEQAASSQAATSGGPRTSTVTDASTEDMAAWFATTDQNNSAAANTFANSAAHLHPTGLTIGGPSIPRTPEAPQPQTVAEPRGATTGLNRSTLATIPEENNEESFRCSRTGILI